MRRPLPFNLRRLAAAKRLSAWTTAMEFASVGTAAGAGHLSLQRDACASGVGIRLGIGREERLCIGMARRAEYTPGRAYPDGKS